MTTKEWYKKRNLKNLKQRTKNKKRKKSILKKQHDENFYQKQISLQQNKEKIIEKNGHIKIPFKVPKKFSLVDNADETINFFNTILDYIKNKYNKGNQLFFNMSDVEEVSNDALMYLIAIIKNAKIKFDSSGNLPQNKECKSLVLESGFLDYMNTLQNIELTTTTNKLKIRMGNTIDINVAKSICDFFIENCGISKNNCKFMYDIIIELMTNTIQHAYTNSMLIGYWYVFLEIKDNIVRVVFLDTGSGIPETLRKKWFEKIKILNLKNDTELIQSALNGEFRSRTLQKYRGKGLPKIYQYYKSNKIDKLKLISRYGIVNENNKILQSKLQGTLFIWDVNISRLLEGDVENGN